MEQLDSTQKASSEFWQNPLDSFGIRGRLVLSFSIITLFTIVGAVVAGINFLNINKKMEDVITQNLPEMTYALKLSEESGFISSVSYALVASKTHEEKKQISLLLNSSLAKAQSHLKQLQHLLGEKSPLLIKIKQEVDQIELMLTNLKKSVENHDALLEKLEDMLKQITDFQEKIELELAPIIDDVNFNLMLGYQKLREHIKSTQSPENIPSAGGSSSENLEKKLSDFRTYMELHSHINLILAILVEVDAVQQVELLGPAKEKFLAVKDKITKLSNNAKKNKVNAMPFKTIDTVIDLSLGKNGIFEIKKKELEANKEILAVLDSSRKLNSKLMNNVSDVVRNSSSSTDEASNDSRNAIQLATIIQLLVVLVTISLSLVIVFMYVRGNIIQRLVDIKNAMQKIADGDLQAQIPQGGNDEITEMAQTIEIFKNNAIEIRRLTEEASNKTQEQKFYLERKINELTEHIDNEGE